MSAYPDLDTALASMRPDVAARLRAAHGATSRTAQKPITVATLPAAVGDVDALTNQSMNKTEAAYGAVLDARKARGEVAWWRFGALNLRIGEKCFYHTDFMVLLADGHIELHETKGFMRDDAQIKLRAIREMYPFFAVVVVKKGKCGTWEYDRR